MTQSQSRPAVPIEIQRRLLIEAGYRCAMPRCDVTTPLEFDHIDDWAKVKEHKAENMIVLCANCHGRKASGQIDRKALKAIKANLAVINGRYSDVERRALLVFADQRRVLARVATTNPELLTDNWQQGYTIQLPGTMRMMMMFLVSDGIVELVPPGTVLLQYHDGRSAPIKAPTATEGILPSTEFYRLTAAGVEFLDAWQGAVPVDEVAATIEDGVIGVDAES